MRRGLTLVEALFVIAICAILAAVMWPVTARAKRQADATDCHLRLRQCYEALAMYANDNDGPPLARWWRCLPEEITSCPESGRRYMYHLEFNSHDAEVQAQAEAWAAREWATGCVVLRCTTHLRGNQTNVGPPCVQCLGVYSTGTVDWVPLSDNSKAMFVQETFSNP